MKEEEEKSESQNASAEHQEQVTESIVAHEQQSPNAQSPQVELLPTNQNISSPKLRRSTGPRTRAGKRRSRYNAVKHRLFAKAILLEGESLAEYEALRKGLWEEWEPESASEMEDVDYLVTLYWRRRRVAKAENAEIANVVNFKTYDSHHAPRLEAWQRPEVEEITRGRFRYSPKRLVIEYASEMLGIFRDSLEKYGFHADEDPWLRTELYRRYHGDETLKHLPGHSESPSLAIDECKAKDELRHDEFIAEICGVILDELEHLNNISFEEVFAEKQTAEYKTIAALIPFRDLMDAIVRVQAHTSHEIDRTISRLERARRRRQGLPEPPTLRLKLDE